MIIDYNRLIEYASTFKGADVYYRDDCQCYYFSLLGKCFGMLSSNQITLKGAPEYNKLLRNKYKDINPGYHTNKIHWITVNLNTKEVKVDLVFELIRNSYNLVLQKLTKLDKQIIDEM